MSGRRRTFRNQGGKAFWLLFGLALLFLVGWGLTDSYKGSAPAENSIDAMRERQEMDAGLWSDIRVVSGFEASESLPVVSHSPTHFEVDVGGEFRHWFMFKLSGVADRTVRIDLKGAPLKKWATLNPVYCYTTELASAASFASKSAPPPALIPTINATSVPETAGIQDWHFVRNVWIEADKLCFVQDFERDTVFVAMRYPAPPSVVEDLFARYAQAGDAEVITLGKTAEGRPLRVVVVGDPVAQLTAGKPCLVMYGREHAAEQDPTWVIDGAIRYLISAAPEAAQLRERFNFIFLPLVNPDGSASGKFAPVQASFHPFTESPESVLIAEFFEAWTKRGGRLDLVLNLHNVESSEGPHMFCPQLDAAGETTAAHARAIHDQIVRGGRSLGFDVASEPRRRSGVSAYRLGGWVAGTYGTVHLPYEVNSQAPSRHLTLAELRQLGSCLLTASADYLASSDGKQLLRAIDDKREQRRQEWERRGRTIATSNIIRMESELLYQIETSRAEQ